LEHAVDYIFIVKINFGNYFIHLEKIDSQQDDFMEIVKYNMYSKINYKFMISLALRSVKQGNDRTTNGITMLSLLFCLPRSQQFLVALVVTECLISKARGYRNVKCAFRNPKLTKYNLLFLKIIDEY